VSARPYSRRSGLILFAAALILLLIFGRSLCSLLIDYKWWGEMGQVNTWQRMWLYRYVPDLAQWLILAVVLWVAHALGLNYAGGGGRVRGRYTLIVTGAILLVSLILAAASVDGWVVARFIGGRGVGNGPDPAWIDPVFGRSLAFYFFELPFYTQLTGFLEVCAAAGAVVYYLTARVWQVRLRFPDLWSSGQLNWDDLRRLGRLETGIFRVLLALFLAGLAVYFWLGRYELLYTDHGELMTGIDYVQQHLGLPLQTAKAAAALLAAVLVLAGQRKLALACALVLVADAVIPPAVNALQVRPNELALQRPFIERHIEATRAAYGLNRRAREAEFPARKEAPINFTRNASMLDNVRLWDWRAFHDTLSQSQPLRPYAYAETDVDRYQIGGQMRQVLLAPRELDLTQLGDAQSRWVISHTIYTHGYGLALAEASRISPTGLPELLIRNAPVEVLTPSLKLTRPEIYYGEGSGEPVFVRTTQPEFNYPSGSEEVHTRYEGHGGIPVDSMGTRLTSAWAFGDPNIVLSDALTAESRMMIRRGVRDRLSTLAPFITWDPDAYLVIGDDGRLVWIVDGYTTSEAHPYARPIQAADTGEFNYIRNSVKATVDAYHGDVKLYLFDSEDPLILAYQNLFPGLLTPASEMPADVRRHVRFPELLFRVQAELYRTYHMRVPESFYNRADLWDLATFTNGQAGAPQTVTPTYMVATLPGESQPEFLLTVPFTPHNKQNLIGLMAARCDGEHLGEIVFLQLPKQEIIPGPLQIEALINQNPVISKDLSLWNQQGSQVLRSQILVLPIDNTFLFVAPIYIQAAQARMPQLEKVALAAGNDLVYADTYQQALVQLAALQRGAPPPPVLPNVSNAAPAPAPAPGADTRIETIRGHLDHYRALSAQGKWAEAGKELEAVESLVKK
jgi:uncharacterized membrane protein (UPF0182 family)